MKKSKIYYRIAMGILLVGINFSTFAVIDTYSFDNPRQEAQYRALIDEFRCPKCQNQNLAGSDAPIAQDLKKKTYDMVKDGRSDAEIRKYMSERYGDFISYKPPVRPSTWILWYLPPVILLLGLVGWFLRQRYRKKPAIQTNLAENNLAEKGGHNLSKSDDDTLTPLSSEEKHRLETLLKSSLQSSLTNSPTATHKE